MHCRIDGPAAYDILTNFEERWLKASKPRGLQKLKASSYDDALLKLERISDIIGMADASCPNENDPEAWHVQVIWMPVVCLHQILCKTWLSIECSISLDWLFEQLKVFRSIDSTSVEGFPKEPKEATSKVRKNFGKILATLFHLSEHVILILFLSNG